MRKLLLSIIIVAFISAIAHSQVTVKIPTSTVVVVKTQNSLASDKLTQRQEVVLAVAADVVVKSHVVIKSGTPVIAIVESAESAGMVGQAGKITIAIQSTTAVDGTTVALTGTFFSKGESKTGETVAVGVVLCPLALLCKGEEGDIPAGAQSRALTLGEVEVSVKD
jgi:DNA-binding transcriptional regulator WhiA